MNPLYVLGYLWALPFTLVGGLAALFSLSRPYRITNGVVLCLAGTWVRAFFRNGNFGAMTWAGVVFTADILLPHDEQDAAILRHELVHFRQAMRWGALFPVAYGAASLLAWIGDGDAYTNNAFEVAARKEAGR